MSMLTVSSSNSNSGKWDSYQFQIEKYMDQMTSNPYLNELEDDLFNQKYQKLESLLDKKLLESLDTDIIDKIFLNFNNDKKLKQLNDNIVKVWKEQSSSHEKKELIYQCIIETKKIFDEQIKIVKLKPTELRISTMTACCEIGCEIDTKFLYEKFVTIPNVTQFLSTNSGKYQYHPSLVGKVIGCKAENYPTKGWFSKEKKSSFFNSAALNVVIGTKKTVNLKVFKNGKLQMTGVPNEEGGEKAISIVIELIKSIADDTNTGKKIVFDKKRLELIKYRTVLINSDYYSGMEIQRENLFHILQDKYDLSVSYESENYPGVKLEYFWNTLTLGSNSEGKCCCSKKCIGKGEGKKDRDCKKVTISTFQSGKVIVTGARNREQINSAYTFINKIFQDNYTVIRKKVSSNKFKLKNNSNQQKLFFLKKSNIKNYYLYNTMITN